MLFAAVSGSSPATVVAIGSIVIAGMVRAGYTQSFATGVIVNAGTLGILIPPSIVMVVYAAATETSVGRLFIAGIIPGIMLGTCLMVAIYIAARFKKLPRQPKVPWGERLVLFRDALWGLLLIFIVMGGIYGGVFTPTEAAAVAAVYAFVAAVFIYGDLTLTNVPRVLLDSGRVSVMLMFIIANAFLFGHVLTTAQILAGYLALDRRRPVAAVAVPAGRQHYLAGGWQLHGSVCDCADHRADPVSDRDLAWHRPDPSGHRLCGEHGDRPGDSAGRAQPFRGIGHHQDAADGRGARVGRLADDFCSRSSSLSPTSQ